MIIFFYVRESKWEEENKKERKDFRDSIHGKKILITK
jgi:hypothetical protein